MLYQYLITLFIICFGALSAAAVPARPGIRTFTRPDGSTIELQMIGDEFFHYFVDKDGNAFMRDENGEFLPLQDSELNGRRHMASDRRRERHIPAHTPGYLPEKTDDAGSSLRIAGVNENSQVKHQGEVNIPVILVQYKDVRFRDSNPYTTFSNFFTQNPSSARKYFLDQSNSMFSPNFDLYGPITLKNSRSYYGANMSGGGDRGVGKMVAEACLAADNKIDFSRYDYNGDGECDIIIILYAGDGEASSSSYNASNAIWPCQWDLETSDYGSSLTLDDTKVNMFAVFNELNGDNLSKIDGIGTFCHEFSHCLGLPDFYDTTYGPRFGMGPWSVMDFGSYNNEGYLPLGYSAYEKDFMGWISIPEAEQDTHYHLTPMMNTQTDSSKIALKFTNPADPNEFYIAEPRHRRNWDRGMPAEGLLITHFTYSPSAWELNCVNDFDLQRATVIPADGRLRLIPYQYYGQLLYKIDDEDTKTDLWPLDNRTELTDYSTPAAEVNTGGFMSKPILDITLNEDMSVDFSTGSFTSGIDSPISTPSNNEEDYWVTLQGTRLCRPTAPGVYIHVSHSGTSKIVIP